MHDHLHFSFRSKILCFLGYWQRLISTKSKPDIHRSWLGLNLLYFWISFDYCFGISCQFFWPCTNIQLIDPRASNHRRRSLFWSQARYFRHPWYSTSLVLIIYIDDLQQQPRTKSQILRQWRRRPLHRKQTTLLTIILIKIGWTQNI